MEREDIRDGRGQCQVQGAQSTRGMHQWGAVSPELPRNAAKGQQNQGPRGEALRQASKKRAQKASHQRTQRLHVAERWEAQASFPGMYRLDDNSNSCKAWDMCRVGWSVYVPPRIAGHMKGSIHVINNLIIY